MNFGEGVQNQVSSGSCDAVSWSPGSAIPNSAGAKREKAMVSCKDNQSFSCRTLKTNGCWPFKFIFLKFSSPETSFQIVYGRITKIDARIEDRKLAITFKVLICPKFHWPYSIVKCSRIRFRPVWASRSIEIIWFPSLSSLKSNFEQNLWFIQKNFLDQIHQKTCQTRYQPQISYIF